MNKLVQQNAKRFAHIETHASIGKLPPLKTPRNQSIIEESDGMAQKKLLASNRRTRSLAR